MEKWPVSPSASSTATFGRIWYNQSFFLMWFIQWSMVYFGPVLHCIVPYIVPFVTSGIALHGLGGRNLVRVRIRAPGHITGDPSNASGAVVRFPNPPTCFWKQAKRPTAKKCPKNTVTQEHQGLLKQGLSQHVVNRSGQAAFRLPVWYSLPSDHISIFIHRVQKPCMICTGARNVRWNPKPAMWNDLLSFNDAASAFCNCVNGVLFVYHCLTSSTSI